MLGNRHRPIRMRRLERDEITMNKPAVCVKLPVDLNLARVSVDVIPSQAGNLAKTAAGVYRKGNGLSRPGFLCKARAATHTVGVDVVQ